MYVKAAPGSRCPMDGKPREFITDSPVEVADSAYYRRLIADGSLVVVGEEAAAPTGRQDNKRDKNRPAGDSLTKED